MIIRKRKRKDDPAPEPVLNLADPPARASSPHCDDRILHAPGECEYCDNYPDWQQERMAFGIAFTGHVPLPGQQPCPADSARPPGSPSDHRNWGGNRPRSGNDFYQMPGVVTLEDALLLRLAALDAEGEKEEEAEEEAIDPHEFLEEMAALAELDFGTELDGWG